MRSKHLSLLALFVASALAAGCDKATPTAPTGSTLTISASPREISANGTSVVTVTAMRGSGGGPVTPGTEIRLSTTLGTIDEVVTTDASGVARATLRGAGRTGTATVTASSGAATAVNVEVRVGSAVERINLSTNPSSVDADEDAVINVTATVRDNQGQPLADAGVVFGAEIGQFDQTGVVRTNASGQATNRLRVTTAQLSLVSDTLEVRAEVSAGGANANATAQVFIERPPIANFSFTISGRTVTFTDQSTGNPTEWEWDIDDNGSVDGTSRVYTHTFTTAGTHDVRLTVRNAFGVDDIVQQVTITAN